MKTFAKNPTQDFQPSSRSKYVVGACCRSKLPRVYWPLRRFVFPDRVITASFLLQGLQFMGVLCITCINCQCSNVQLIDLRTAFSQR